MKFLTMQHIPLAFAYLCPNCDCIGNCANQCPACASKTLLGLANILDRAEDGKSVGYAYARGGELAA